MGTGTGSWETHEIESTSTDASPSYRDGEASHLDPARRPPEDRATSPRPCGRSPQGVQMITDPTLLGARTTALFRPAPPEARRPARDPSFRSPQGSLLQGPRPLPGCHDHSL